MQPLEITAAEDEESAIVVGRTDRYDVVATNEAFLDEDYEAIDGSCAADCSSWMVGCMWLSFCFLLSVLAMVLVLTEVSSFQFITASEFKNPVLRFHRICPNQPPTSARTSTPPTTKSSSWTFQIMQITDIHLGEAEDTDWGPRQDQATFRLLEKMLDEYETPDLIVLGGDQLTANNCLHNCTEYYKILGNFLSQYNIPWATIMGNHDDMDFEVPGGTSGGGNETIPHTYTRRELLAVDQAFPLSLSRAGPTDVTGASNYVLDIQMDDSSSISGKPAAQIFFLDSGGGSLQEAIDDSQVRWLRESAKLQDVPAIAFQHIPTSAHEYDIDVCMGYQGEGVEEIRYDGGVVGAMVESGRFHFLAVGHNHGNDYCCPHRGPDGGNKTISPDLYFCFGRHSGYGGYGKWRRGVRMYELLLTDADGDGNTKVFKWRTWVRFTFVAPPESIERTMVYLLTGS